MGVNLAARAEPRTRRQEHPMSKPSLARHLATLAVTSALFAGSAHAEQELRVLNWQGYGTDEAWALEAFQKQTGIKVYL